MPRHVDRRKWCQLNSTADRRQFITLSGYLCVYEAINGYVFVYKTMGVAQRIAVLTPSCPHELTSTLRRLIGTKFQRGVLLFLEIPKFHYNTVLDV